MILLSIFFLKKRNLLNKKDQKGESVQKPTLIGNST